MEYYSAINKDEVMIHTTTCMKLKNIMLNERSQSQKSMFYAIPCMQNVQNRQIHTDRKLTRGCQGLEEEAAHGYRVPFGGDERVQEPDGGDGHTRCECTKCHGVVQVKMLTACDVNFTLVKTRKDVCIN